MVLILSNSDDLTVDYLILEFQRRGSQYIRINTEDFPTKLNLKWSNRQGQITGSLEGPSGLVEIAEVKSVWYRRPTPPIPPEQISDPGTTSFVIDEAHAALHGFWNSLDCLWVSRPESIWKAESKLYQLKIANEIGFFIPPTLVTNDPIEAKKFYEEQDTNVIYKVLRKGKVASREGTGWIFTSRIHKDHLKRLKSIEYAPGLFQKYYPKLSDLRVTVVGQEVFAAEIHSQLHPDAVDDWRRVDAHLLKHTPYSLPNDISNYCVELISKLGLAFGAIDLIRGIEGEHIFLEINPNGQWAWIQQLCPGLRIREALADLLTRDGD